MTEACRPDPPSPFIEEWTRRFPAAAGARALDLAMGRGRHARLLAQAGFRTFGVDIAPDVVGGAVRALAEEGHPIIGWCADLTKTALPAGFFDAIVVVRYLQRDLMGSLADALRPGGMLLYETFTTAQLGRGRGPTSPDHLLEPDELRTAFPSLDVIFYDEPLQPDAIARLAARRP